MFKIKKDIIINLIFLLLIVRTYLSNFSFLKPDLLLIFIPILILLLLPSIKCSYNKIFLILMFAILFVSSRLLNYLIIPLSWILIDNIKDKNKFMKNMFYLCGVLFCGIIFIDYLGFIENKIISRRYIEGIGYTKIREYLGFSNPNSALSYFASIQLYYYYSYKKTKNKIVTLIIFLIIIYLYKKTDSRTGLIISILLNFRSILNSKLIIKIIPKALFLYYTLISLCFIYFFDNNYLNKILSNRPLTYYEQLKNGVKILFGQGKIEGIPLDNIYILLLSQGILFLLLFNVLYYLYIKRLKKEKKINELWIILVVLLAGIFESWPLNPILNPTLLLMFNKDNGEKNE